ncbi:hypothetical protein ACGFZK_09035 [Streptomyces sp. NPDC048257]|uniref:hypothetical protein n=1 Tax=Streptomyces sp. NPDC048257 TaxID=3365526 RepID=UPI003721F2CB
MPTGPVILYHLSDLRLRVTSATDPPVIAITCGIIQLHLLDRLGTHTSPLVRDLNEPPAKTN